MMKMASLFQAGRWGRGFLVWVLASGLAPVVPVAFAQELLPELAAPAAQHKAADEALDKQKLEAIAAAAKSYVSTLDSIEKSATAKGEIDLVAAVVKEREAVATGALEPDLPAALPKARLQMARKTLLTSVERINADFAMRRKKADADYLRVLATLQTKAAANPELAKQIAAEKAALLDGGAGSVGIAAKVSRGKNVVVNGDFEKIVDGKPDGWEKQGLFSVVTERDNTFLRLDARSGGSDGKGKGGYLRQDIERPQKASGAIISARMRATEFDLSKKLAAVATVVCKNHKGEIISWIHAVYKDKRGQWTTIQGEGNLPKETSGVTIECMVKAGAGQIDFDDIEVTFK